MGKFTKLLLYRKFLLCIVIVVLIFAVLSSYVHQNTKSPIKSGLSTTWPPFRSVRQERNEGFVTKATTTRQDVSRSLPTRSAFEGGSGGGQLKIPHIIHQTWKDKHVPSSVVRYIRSWHKMHPSWEYMFWTDADILRFVKIRYPHFVQTYLDYEMPIMRADVFRYLVLHDIGGLYADLDFESLRPIGNFTSGHTCIISQEPLEHAYLLYDKKRLCSNAIMAATPGHPFFKWLIGELPRLAKHRPRRDVQGKTGPAMLEQAVQNYTILFLKGKRSGYKGNHAIRVASQKELMPQFDSKQRSTFITICASNFINQETKRNICDDVRKTNKNRPLGNAYANHHWVHFWAPWFASGYGLLTHIDSIASYRVNMTHFLGKCKPKT